MKKLLFIMGLLSVELVQAFNIYFWSNGFPNNVTFTFNYTDGSSDKVVVPANEKSQQGIYNLKPNLQSISCDTSAKPGDSNYTPLQYKSYIPNSTAIDVTVIQGLNAHSHFGRCSSGSTAANYTILISYDDSTLSYYWAIKPGCY